MQKYMSLDRVRGTSIDVEYTSKVDMIEFVSELAKRVKIQKTKDDFE